MRQRGSTIFSTLTHYVPKLLSGNLISVGKFLDYGRILYLLCKIFENLFVTRNKNLILISKKGPDLFRLRAEIVYCLLAAMFGFYFRVELKSELFATLSKFRTEIRTIPE